MKTSSNVKFSGYAWNTSDHLPRSSICMTISLSSAQKNPILTYLAKIDKFSFAFKSLIELFNLILKFTECADLMFM